MQYITTALLALLITTPVFGMYKLSVWLACSSPQHKTKRFTDAENQALADADAEIKKNSSPQRRSSIAPIINSPIPSKDKNV